MLSTSYIKFILFLLIAFALASCVSQKRGVAYKPKSAQQDIIDYGEKYLHTPYRYGTTGPNSFDCSGFTSFVFKNFGYNLSPSSAGQEIQVKRTIRKQEDLEVGDLVFFEGRSHNGRVGHVGIVSEMKKHGKFKFLHASTSYGVIYSSSDEPYYKARYLRGGRVLEEEKPMAKVKKKEEAQPTENIYLTQENSRLANEVEVLQQIVTENNTNQSTIHMRNADGSVSINNRTVGIANDNKTTVDPDNGMKLQTTKKQEDDKEKKKEEIRQSAPRLSEEQIVPAPIRSILQVKPGDTLFSISQKINCSVDQLKQWNPSIVNNVIHAGDNLNIYR
ncbi:MAG: NlpC/P60 family protein [Candidatus Saccharimonadaceae bacterium]